MRKLNSLQRTLNTSDHTHKVKFLRKKMENEENPEKNNRQRNEYGETQTQYKHWEIEPRGKEETRQRDGMTRWTETFFLFFFLSERWWYIATKKKKNMLFRTKKKFGIKKSVFFFCCLIICWFFGVNDKLMTLFFCWLASSTWRAIKKENNNITSKQITTSRKITTKQSQKKKNESINAGNFFRFFSARIEFYVCTLVFLFFFFSIRFDLLCVCCIR